MALSKKFVRDMRNNEQTHDEFTEKEHITDELAGWEAVVDVFKCKCLLKCVVNCPWTLKYAAQME